MGQPALHVPTFDELYQQIEDLPEGMTGEILDPGIIRTMSRPRRLHRVAERNIWLSLRERDVSHKGGGWWFDMEVEIRFGQRLLVPDVSGWRVDGSIGGSLEFADDNPILRVPDWCCEILSPSTMQGDRFKKLPRYIQEGVSHVWLVDPESRLVEVYVPCQGLPLLLQAAHEDDVLELPPFSGELDVGSWWRDRVEPSGEKPADREDKAE